MEEPTRIGLTATTNAQLEELLAHLNPENGKDGIRLIKFDLYRLAVALGIKGKLTPPPLSDKSTSNLRVSELDDDGAFFNALENSNLVPEGASLYPFIERLAEHGIKKFYGAYQNTGQLPLEDYFTN